MDHHAGLVSKWSERQVLLNYKYTNYYYYYYYYYYYLDCLSRNLLLKYIPFLYEIYKYVLRFATPQNW
jgi:hypothetical protein